MNLKKLMEEQNKTKYQLSQKLNTNYSVINNMLNNKTKAIHFETIDKLCEFFECEIADLFIRAKDQ